MRSFGFQRHQAMPWLLCFALIVAGTLPVAAQDENDGGDRPDDGGLVIGIESWWTSPQNIDVDYAFVDEGGSLSGGGEVQSLTHDRAAVPVFHVGWRLASAPGTELGARLWQYDESAASATGEFPMSIGALLASPDFKISKVDSATAETDLRATLVEFGATWSHDLGGGGTLGIFAGARLFRFEESTRIAYRREFLQLEEEFIEDTTDANGIGPSAAVSYLHRFGRYGVGASFGIALPIGEIESRTQDQLLVDGAFTNATLVDRPASSRVFTQLDLDLRFTANLGRGWVLTAAYALRHWSGVREGLRFVDDVGQSTTVPVEEDAVFEGPLLGVGYRF